MASAPILSPPHLFMIFVDDLGHANVGFNRHEHNPPQEVASPHIDALARTGIILNRHYVFKICTPSRASLISGRFPVHVTQELRDPEAPNTGVPRNMTGIGVVLQRAGYATHQVGKWDAGMATPMHTPRGRGFDTSLGYFEHKNDFWTRGIMQSSCLKAGGGAYANLTDLWDTTAPAPRSVIDSGAYEEAIFRDRALSIINAHDPSKQPLFLLYTPHVAHCPLQSPIECDAAPGTERASPRSCLPPPCAPACSSPAWPSPTCRDLSARVAILDTLQTSIASIRSPHMMTRTTAASKRVPAFVPSAKGRRRNGQLLSRIAAAHSTLLWCHFSMTPSDSWLRPYASGPCSTARSLSSPPTTAGRSS